MGNIQYDRIHYLCRINNTTAYKMCNDIGISQGAISDLKGGRKKSLSAKALSKIAKYFGSSVDWILYGDKEDGDAELILRNPQPNRMIDTTVIEQIIQTRVALVAMVDKAKRAEESFEASYPEVFSPKGWRELANRYKSEHGEICERCKKETDNLQVHHIRPVNYGYPIICEDKWLVALCPSCHRFVHSKANIQHKYIVLPEGESL